MLAMKEEVDWAKLKSGDSYEQGSVVFMTCVQTWWCSAGQAGHQQQGELRPALEDVVLLAQTEGTGGGKRPGGAVTT